MNLRVDVEEFKEREFERTEKTRRRGEQNKVGLPLLANFGSDSLG